MARQADARRIKSNRTYTVQELARLLDVTEHTVRRWIKFDGLQPIDKRRPMLLAGAEVKRFLDGRKRARKRPCGPTQMYCFKCRDARAPAFGETDFVPCDDTVGNLMGLCPVCGTLMNKRVAKARLGEVSACLMVRFPKGQ